LPVCSVTAVVFSACCSTCVLAYLLGIQQLLAFPTCPLAAACCSGWPGCT
jgi:hypothetical protein